LKTKESTLEALDDEPDESTDPAPETPDESKVAEPVDT